MAFRLMKLALILLLPATVLRLGAGAAQERRPEVAAPTAQVEQHGGFRDAAATPPDAPTAFDFEMNGFSYHVAANGNGRRTKGDKTRRFSLRLSGGEDLRRLSFSDYEGDLLLVCDVEGREGAAGVVTRLEQPSMRALWTQGVPAPGVRALRQGRALYLAGAGVIARLDLRTGEYAWRHRDRREESEGEETEDDARKELIPPGRYEVPEVSGDTLTFRAPADSDNPAPRAVRVNRKSGKIISID